MDDSSENLQEKLSQLADQLSNVSPSTEEALQLKASIEEVLKRLEALKGNK